MKSLILFLAMLLTGVTTFAQYPSLIASTNLLDKNGTLTDSIMITMDSTTYHYSGGRSGDLTHTMKYDTSEIYIVDTAFIGLEFPKRDMQTFSAANNIMTDLYQTDSTGTGTWENTTRYLFNYDGSNNMIAHTIQQWRSSVWSTQNYDSFSYDTYGEILMHTMVQFPGTPVESQTQYLYTYNTTHNLATMLQLTWNFTSSSWDTSVKTIYNYNAAGQDTLDIYENWSSTGWVTAERSVNSHLSSGLLYRTVFQGWDAGSSSWYNVWSTSYGYDGSGHTIADTAWIWTSKWATENSIQYLDFTGPNYQKSLTSAWDIDADTVIGVMQDTLTYNSYGQALSSIYRLLWGYNVYPPKEIPGFRYYYGNTPTIVPQLSAGVDVQAYPVPANDMLHVAINRTSAQGGSIMLTDLEGRVVSRVPVPATRVYNGIIPVSNLPTGTYVLSVTGDDGSNSVKKISIVR